MATAVEGHHVPWAGQCSALTTIVHNRGAQCCLDVVTSIWKPLWDAHPLNEGITMALALHTQQCGDPQGQAPICCLGDPNRLQHEAADTGVDAVSQQERTA